jgi:hypothetical protein
MSVAGIAARVWASGNVMRMVISVPEPSGLGIDRDRFSMSALA